MDRPLKIIDSHCHLDFKQFDEQRALLISQCAERGMIGLIVPGVTQSGWHGIGTLCKSSEILFPAYGLHPCFVKQHSMMHLDDLGHYLDKGAVALGEIGLDAYSEPESLDAQIEYFNAQLNMAKNHKLPVIIHSRKTQDLVLKSIRQSKFPYGGIMHAFSGSLQQAQKFIEFGFKLGFGGAATYERASKLRRILKTIPDTAIVLETDAPDIAPSFAKGEPNSPLNLFRITQMLAEVKGCSVVEFANRTSNNVITLLGLPINSEREI